MLVLCNVHIRSHPQNEQQEQITLLEEGKPWFSLLNGEGLEPIVLPWKFHSGHIMELCDECNNCTFSYIQKKSWESFNFFLILVHFVPTLWRHKLSNLNKSKSGITRQPSSFESGNKKICFIGTLKYWSFLRWKCNVLWIIYLRCRLLSQFDLLKKNFSTSL